MHQVAERGYNMLLGQHSLAEEILEQVAQFREEVEARGRAFDPMHVAVARAVHIAEERGRQGGRARAAVPGAYAGQRAGAATRRRDPRRASNRTRKRPGYESAESALFGTPDEIMRKLEALRQGGVEYVIINFGGSRENIRRFAREIMPAFADEPAFALAGK